MMKKIKQASKFMISLCIMFLIIGLLISIFVRSTLLNQNFYIISLNRTEYYNLLKSEIDYGFKNYSLITSIPENVFKSSVSEEDITSLAMDNIQDTFQYMKYKEAYKDEKLNTSKLEKNIRTYVEENSFAVDSNLNNQIKATTAEASDIVNKHAVLFDLAQVIKYKEFQKFRKTLFLVYDNLYIIAGVLILLIFMLFLLNRRHVSSAVLWLAGAMIPASLTVLIPPILGLAYKIPYRFSLGNYYIKVALSVFTLGYIKYFLIIGGCLLGLAIIMIIYISKRVS